LSRSTADRTTETAEALRAWLQSQRTPPAATPQDPLPVSSNATTAAANCTPTAVKTVGPQKEVPASAGTGAVASVRSLRRADDGNRRHLAHTDWLHHRLIVRGPAADIATFRAAAAGAGTIPWHLDLDRLEEDWFHLLVSPPAPQQRSLSAEGARVFAGQLRAAVSLRHELGVARVSLSRACPFDLHALVPVPAAVLRLGPDDPASLDWLWTHWGTTQALRHVAVNSSHSDGEGQGGQTPVPDGRTVGGDDTIFRATFWSADWTPWQALAQIAERWPSLQVEARPTYEAV
jgi:hypothetical protein